ncbi:quinolinate synthase NadA [Methanofollis aquaemaris]|uniref:Quinolinate synthase n=1 Tax=Methanofollis aquaemaris TaxID=126734 RepID=A0A8A3S9B5_9EURY|nr:quinolinate synthase NadA [Methanofollis aquaemaris]QSZ68086.1 quinolinate synthase NadA [Methanofollis aquaemaris]
MIQDEIRKLKEEQGAVILAHNYQIPEVQEIADFVGDSLELAIKAKEATADVLVFCGVEFMAETAKILNPSRKVLLPVKNAGCPLADCLTPEMVREAKARHPNAAVVLYVNSTIESKAEADITCTSANAVEVVESLAEKTVLFGPDANLAHYVAEQVSGKTIIPLPADGHCPVHREYTLADVEAAHARGDAVVCHPECDPEVQEASDLVASTGGMARQAHLHQNWTVLTEEGMAYRLGRLFPDRTFHAVEGVVCEDMKRTTLEDVRRALETGEYEVTIDEEIADRARKAIERMIALRG